MEDVCKVLNSTTVYSGRIFDVLDEQVILPGGKTVHRATVVHPGAVVILPRLESGNFLVIRQYRHPIGKSILEFPAGTLAAGEAPLDCAKREISEETGYQAETWRPLGILYPGPGICSEIQHLYLAEKLSPRKLPGDEDELIEVLEMSAGQVEEAVRTGELSDAKSIALFMRARLAGLLD